MMKNRFQDHPSRGFGIVFIAIIVSLGLLSVACTRTSSLTIETLGDGSVIATPSENEYDPGSIVVLTAVPDTGGGFIGWEGDASGSENPLSLILDEDSVITALFNPVKLAGGQVTVTACPQMTQNIGDWAYFTLSLSLPAGQQYRVWVYPFLPDGYPGNSNNYYSSPSSPLASDASGIDRGAVLSVLDGSYNLIEYAWGGVRQWRIEIASVGTSGNIPFLTEDFTYPVTWQ